MAVNAKPYQEGKGWAIRLRYKGNDIYVSGKPSAAKAVAEAQKHVNHIDKHGQPAWGGPKGKTVAQALQRQAGQTLRFKKGGIQEARRINCYLRHAGVDEIVLTKIPDDRVEMEELPGNDRPGAKPDAKKKSVRVYFTHEWKPAQSERSIPNSLRSHRKLLTVKSADSDRLRAQIARSKFTEVTTDLMQSFVDALVDEGAKAATVYQEVAILRQLFNHALKRWRWREPEVNPASGLNMPPIDNERTRVMSVEEQTRLVAALRNRRAKGVVELVTLGVETAMRAEELVGLTWSEVRSDELVIRLDDAKSGARDVPLSPAAVELLDAMRQGAKSERVFPGMTYAKLAAAWRLACKEAGVDGLWFHDVRATAATRFALGPAGRNIFLIQALTGHKTLVMLERYVRVTAADAAQVMRRSPPAAPANLAGGDVATPPAEVPPTKVASESAKVMAHPEPTPHPAVSQVHRAQVAHEVTKPNVVLVDFGARRRA